MRAYGVSGPNASGAATKTGATVVASATVRPRVYEAIIGNSATPADQAALYALTRFTAAGTAGSSPTPIAVDPGDVAAVATAGITHSAEPTYAATDLLQIPLNQRATHRWVAWQPGYELMAPATAANGIGARLVSASASLASNFNLFWYE
jgi:hypothetical protein